MLFETAKTDERPSKPTDVLVVVEALGRLHGMSTSAAAPTIRANLRALLESNGGAKNDPLPTSGVADS